MSGSSVSLVSDGCYVYVSPRMRALTFDNVSSVDSLSHREDITGEKKRERERKERVGEGKRCASSLRATCADKDYAILLFLSLCSSFLFFFRGDRPIERTNRNEWRVDGRKFERESRSLYYTGTHRLLRYLASALAHFAINWRESTMFRCVEAHRVLPR